MTKCIANNKRMYYTRRKNCKYKANEMGGGTNF